MVVHGDSGLIAQLKRCSMSSVRLQDEHLTFVVSILSAGSRNQIELQCGQRSESIRPVELKTLLDR